MSGLFSMQINVPHSTFGVCSYFIPNEICLYLIEHGLRYGYVGRDMSGNGLTNGVTNVRSTYMIYNIEDESFGILFKIMFPACGIHFGEQYARR